MKAEELMVGDYLTFRDALKDNNLITVKVVAINGATNELLASIDGDPTLDRIDIDDELCGIPITPEFLENNGWEHDPSVQRIMINTNFQRNNFFIMTWDSKSHVLHIDVRRDCDIHIPCEYVHILQHCLKFCGIDKTIEL